MKLQLLAVQLVLLASAVDGRQAIIGIAKLLGGGLLGGGGDEGGEGGEEEAQDNRIFGASPMTYHTKAPPSGEYGSPPQVFPPAPPAPTDYVAPVPVPAPEPVSEPAPLPAPAPAPAGNDYGNKGGPTPDLGAGMAPPKTDYTPPAGGDMGIPEGGDMGIPEGGDMGIPEGGDMGIPEGGDAEGDYGTPVEAPMMMETPVPSPTLPLDPTLPEVATTNNKAEASSGLSIGATVGIAVGVLVACALALVIAVRIRSHRQAEQVWEAHNHA